MKYYYRYFTQYSKFFNDVLSNQESVYFDASYLYNYQSSCYNLASKKKLHYFIDPESFKFQYGGDKSFFLNYLKYFEELEGLFDKENRINLDLLNQSMNFEDFYKKIVRFQRTMLASTHIPLDFYASIVEGTSDLKTYNPLEQLKFIICPYFEFYEVDDIFYKLNKRFSDIAPINYVLLRFPKNILSEHSNIDKIVNDFKGSAGILLNIINLNQYDIADLEKYFGNLIDLIYKFAKNHQNVILMNNSEFGKYFKYFGLNEVCSNVMIGQKTIDYEPNRASKRQANTDFAYMPQIERSVSITSSQSLISRCKALKKSYPDGVIELSLDSRIQYYYDFIKEKIKKINTLDFKGIIKEFDKNFKQLDYKLHQKKYKYVLYWKELLNTKYKEFFK